jgi:hypothetical protein
MKANSFRMWRTRMKGRVTKRRVASDEMNSNRQQAKHQFPQG